MQSLGLSDSTPKTEGRFRALFWPTIDSDIAAETAVRNAMYATWGISAVTCLLILTGAVQAYGLIEVALFLALGIGIRQFSVAASALALLLYLADVGASLRQGQMGLGIVTVIVIGLFLSAFRASLFMYRWPEPVPPTTWTRVWRAAWPVTFLLCGVVWVLFCVGLFMQGRGQALE